MSKSTSYRRRKTAIKNFRLKACPVESLLNPTSSTEQCETLNVPTSSNAIQDVQPQKGCSTTESVYDAPYSDTEALDNIIISADEARVSRVSTEQQTCLLLSTPREVLDLAAIASKYKISDVCLRDIIGLCASICKDEYKKNFRNLSSFEKSLGLHRFTGEIHYNCIECGKLFVELLKKKPFNRSCCGHSFSPNTPHSLILNLREILQVLMPRIEDKMCRIEPPKYKFHQDLHLKINKQVNDISMTLNTDGAPLFSSSSASLWPVLASIDDVDCVTQKKNILLLGVWIANKGTKPNFDSLLPPILAQIYRSLTVPVLWKSRGGQEIESRVFVSLVCCDSIARSPVQGLMQFNAEYGCSYCLHKEAGHYFTTCDSQTTLRIDSEHRRLCKTLLECNKSDLKGITSVSPFVDLEYIDMIQAFPPDVMHAVYLGIAKLLTCKWLKDVGTSYYLSEQQKLVLDQLLVSIKPPKRVSRIPRSLKYSSLYKAHEWAMWFLYYSPILLEQVLHQNYYNHYMLLVRGMSLLLGRRTNNVIVNESRGCLSEFHANISHMYDKTTCRYNAHLLLHFPDFAWSHGPLQNYSLYPFENFNMILRTYVSGSQQVASQIFKRYIRDIVVDNPNYHNLAANEFSSNNDGWNEVNGSKLHGLLKQSLISDAIVQFMKSKFKTLNNLEYYARGKIKNRVFQSRLYTKVKSRNSYCYILCETNVFVVDFFVQNKSTKRCYAVGYCHSVQQSHHGLKYIYCSTTRELRMVDICSLQDNLLTIQIDERVYFVEFLNSVENICS